MPIGIKDVINTADMPTECDSPIYRGRRPAADAASVARLKAAGAILMGKTVTTEFAFQRPGKTRNPHNPEHTPGGSSSGSAAAVAERMVPAALGTQTGGSVIRPAAFCGVIGYKPTYGSIPTRGLKYLSPGLDTLGFMVRSLDDIAPLMRVLADVDVSLPNEASSAPPLVVCRTGHWDTAEAPMQQLFDAVAAKTSAAKAKQREISLPAEFATLDAAHRVLLSADMAISFAREMAESREQLGDAIRDFIESTGGVSPEDINAKWTMLRSCREQLRDLFAADEIILTLSAPGEAPRGLHSTGNAVFNRLWTMLHVPCLHLPVDVGPNGLPIGVQLVSPHCDERALLAAGRWLAHQLDLPLFG